MAGDDSRPRAADTRAREGVRVHFCTEGKRERREKRERALERAAFLWNSRGDKRGERERDHRQRKNGGKKKKTGHFSFVFDKNKKKKLSPSLSLSLGPHDDVNACKGKFKWEEVERELLCGQVGNRKGKEKGKREKRRRGG